MHYKVLLTTIFSKHFKAILKKYLSLKEDVLQLIILLEKNPTIGIALGKNCFKIRLKISGKATGKSGGASVITYVVLPKNEV